MRKTKSSGNLEILPGIERLVWEICHSSTVVLRNIIKLNSSKRKLCALIVVLCASLIIKHSRRQNCGEWKTETGFVHVYLVSKISKRLIGKDHVHRTG